MANPLVDMSYGLLESKQQLTNPLLLRLLEEWHGAALPCGMPDHSFADPLKLIYLLGSLLVVGVERDGTALQFRYRLIGTDLVARINRDFTGKMMHEHSDPEVARIGPLACSLSVEKRAPVRLAGARVFDERRFPLEYLILPLVSEGQDQADRLLIAQIYPQGAPRVPYGSAE